MIIRIFLLTFFVGCVNLCFTQICVYQDIWNGGIKALGFSTGMGTGNKTLDLSIPSGSTIKAVFLTSYSIKDPDSSLIFINGINVSLNETNLVTEVFHASPDASPIRIYFQEISAILTGMDLSNLMVEIGSPCLDEINCGYWTAFFVVIYENPSSSKVSASLYIPDKNLVGNEDYQLLGLNPIVINYPVAFSIDSDRSCDIIDDGSVITLESTSIGIIGGNDDASTYFCPGSQGCFQYENMVLNGLSDDLPNLQMNGTDALSDISSIISNGQNNLSLNIEHQVAGSPPGDKNINLLFSIASSTNCNTFSINLPSDTVICQGESFQFITSGGQTYQWFPSTGLSCSDCPDPVFTGDSSMFYTVRIWNNDSCSVVRPVRITVLPKPQFGSINVSASDCGTANGTVNLTVLNGTVTPVFYTLQGGPTQSIGLFDSLAQGNYVFYLEDGNGCVSDDTLVFVPEMNNTVAAFTVSPDYGTAPLTVQINNTSQNTTGYLWSVNETSEGSSFNSFICDTSGIYTIELVAWQFDPSCADTAYQTIQVIDRLIIPTAFTPDGDGVNDTWELPNIDMIYPENVISVYNRWGEILFQTEKGKYSIKPWNGRYNNEPLPVGSYYFIIETNDPIDKTFNGTVSIIR